MIEHTNHALIRNSFASWANVIALVECRKGKEAKISPDLAK
ncbi:protein of unknown function [Xenorhabdus nematophila AN6/1]|nr:hypothetical protein XNA1_4860005 [Xenorhabdus nematophila str. Anatoliense]CEK24978.1 protein of unknown function [Xenorhabdus nematophila AN6/1]